MLFRSKPEIKKDILKSDTTQNLRRIQQKKNYKKTFTKNRNVKRLNIKKNRSKKKREICKIINRF